MSKPINPLRATLAASLLGLAATAALADPGVVRINTPSGQVYADARGMALYVFDKDEPGKSNCDGDCAAKWPPLVAPAGSTATGAFAPITRSDGTMQWAMDGRPLYLWVKDTAPGQTTGDGVGGVWHVAK
ncbi:COG4315 family predicted lipoprotein [Paracoccus luteus]|uniref:COG4315 family predicted lipoprotein n=1 Tax=Paracoccus luteus TaxID=2508543 RepID=UPI00106F21F9|nr:hypothetical protein [Paracoccus luteus]